MNIRGSHKNVSHMAAQFIPEGVAGDAEMLIRILEAYYEWADLNGSFQKESFKFSDALSTITASDDWLQIYKDTLLRLFPELTPMKIRELLKFSRTFYSERGTPESFKFLFKTIWNVDDIELEYPSEFILRSSDGVWASVSSMQLDVSTFPSEIPLNNVLIEGTKSGARAIITNYIIKDNIATVDLENVYKDFIPNEIVTVYNNVASESRLGILRTIGVFADYEIINAGAGYLAGRQINIKKEGDGTGLEIEVGGVDPITGKITSINIKNVGSGYLYEAPTFDWQDVYLFDVRIDKQLRRTPEIVFKLVANYNTTGKYLNKKSMLSDLWKLRDGEFYHEYAYIIKTSLDSAIFTKAIKELVHPAGMTMHYERVYPPSAVTYKDLTDSIFDVSSNFSAKIDGLVRYSNYDYYGDRTSIYMGEFASRDGAQAGEYIKAPVVDISKYENEIFDQLKKDKEKLDKISGPYVPPITSNTYDNNWYGEDEFNINDKWWKSTDSYMKPPTIINFKA